MSRAPQREEGAGASAREPPAPALSGLRMIDRLVTAVGGRAHSQAQLNLHDDDEVAEITACMGCTELPDDASAAAPPAGECPVRSSPATILPCPTRQRSVSTNAEGRGFHRHVDGGFGSPLYSSSGSDSELRGRLWCPRPVLAWSQRSDDRCSPEGRRYQAVVHEAEAEASRPTASSPCGQRSPSADSPTFRFNNVPQPPDYSRVDMAGRGPSGRRRRPKKHRTSSDPGSLREAVAGLAAPPTRLSRRRPERKPFASDTVVREAQCEGGASGGGAEMTVHDLLAEHWSAGSWLTVSSPRAGNTSPSYRSPRRGCRLPEIQRRPSLVQI